MVVFLGLGFLVLRSGWERAATCRLAPERGWGYSKFMTEGVSIDPAVCHGKPVIKGTRVLVSTILGALAGGDSREVVASDYSITSEQIAAALQFAGGE